MPRNTKSLTSMSIDVLLKLRDEISAVLSARANELHRQIAILTGSPRKRGRPAGRKGKKVAPKYRGPGGGDVERPRPAAEVACG